VEKRETVIESGVWRCAVDRQEIDGMGLDGRGDEWQAVVGTEMDL
jgi:hypothetical protein